MVLELDNINKYTPECFFCGKEGNPYMLNGMEKVLVQAVDEEPSEAQKRKVCEDCDPKR